MEGLDPTGLLSGFSLYTILVAVVFGLVGSQLSATAARTPSLGRPFSVSR
jgi:hypothetical protein